MVMEYLLKDAPLCNVCIFKEIKIMVKKFILLLTSVFLLSHLSALEDTIAYGFESEPIEDYKYEEYNEEDSEGNLWFGIKGSKESSKIHGISLEILDPDASSIDKGYEYGTELTGVKKNKWKTVSLFDGEADELDQNGFLVYNEYEITSKNSYHQLVVTQTMDKKNVFLFMLSLPLEDKNNRRTIRTYRRWIDSINALEIVEEEEEEEEGGDEGLTNEGLTN